MSWTQHVSPAEFEHPDKLHPDLISGLGETRLWLDRPMHFSRSPSGKERHPAGDAVAPDATSHSPASLHRFGIDHIASAITGRIVDLPGALCLACDWDCDSFSSEDLWETYLTLERMNLWEAIGLYPEWNNPGFHVDRRPRAHPNSRARWFRDSDGQYHNLTWENWKEYVLYE